jgi:hypothetical protein
MDLRFHCVRTQWNRGFTALCRQGAGAHVTGNRLSGAEVKRTLPVAAS